MSWKENKGVAVICAIIAIGAIGFVVYKSMPAKLSRDVMCEKCNQVVQEPVAVNATFPIKCAKCGTDTVYPTLKLKCVPCKKEVVVIDKGDGKAMETKCTCGNKLTP